MPEFNLFPPEDTTINCNTPTGEVISVDAMDIDELLIQVYQDKEVNILPRTEFLQLVCDKFKEKYNFSMSKRSMDMLIHVKHQMLEQVKKNSYPTEEPVSSTDSSLGVTET